MSEEIVGTCLKHEDIRHLRLHRDFMDIYQNNEHKAKIVRVLETWTDTKYAIWYKDAKDRKEQKQSVPPFEGWVTMSFQQFSEYMYDTTKTDTIKKNLAELEKDKHVERRVNPDNPYGPPQYRLNLPLIQKLLDERYAKLSPRPGLYTPQDFSTPPGNFTPGRGVKDTPTHGGEIPVPHGGKTPTSNNGTKQSSSKNTKRGVAPANAAQPSPSLSLEEENKSSRETPKSQQETLSPDVEPAMNTPKEQSARNGAKGTKQEELKEEVQESPKRTRSPRVPKEEDMLLKARIEKVYSYFDTLRQEVTNQPEGYARTKKATDAIKDLLKSSPTEERLRKVFMILWNTPKDQRSGFWWRENMTIPAVCGQYEAKMTIVLAQEKREIQPSLPEIDQNVAPKSFVPFHSRDGRRRKVATNNERAAANE